MVERYEPEFLEEYEWTPIRKDTDGDYVLYADYEALQAKLAALVEAAGKAIPAMLMMNERSEGYTLHEKFILMKNLLDNVDNLKAALDAAKEG